MPRKSQGLPFRWPGRDAPSGSALSRDLASPTSRKDMSDRASPAVNSSAFLLTGVLHFPATTSTSRVGAKPRRPLRCWWMRFGTAENNFLRGRIGAMNFAEPAGRGLRDSSATPRPQKQKASAITPEAFTFTRGTSALATLLDYFFRFPGKAFGFQPLIVCAEGGLGRQMILHRLFGFDASLLQPRLPLHAGGGGLRPILISHAY